MRFLGCLSVILLLATTNNTLLLAQESPIDPALVQALHHATQNDNDLQTLFWLSSMSERLEKRLPDPYYRIRLLRALHLEAKAQGLDPQLVLAVIDVESSFNRYALSNAGARGLMQVMPFWKREIGEQDDDLYNPLISLRYGCQILRHYMDKHSKLSDALAAYNGSLGRSKYPREVLKRLKHSWDYQVDSYLEIDQTPVASDFASSK